jgi:hypothetical protein
MTATIIFRIETSCDRAGFNALRPGMFPPRPDRALVFEVLLERPADVRAIAFGFRTGEDGPVRGPAEENQPRTNGIRTNGTKRMKVVDPSSSVFTRGSIASFHPSVRPPEDGAFAWPGKQKNIRHDFQL